MLTPGACSLAKGEEGSDCDSCCPPDCTLLSRSSGCGGCAIQRFVDVLYGSDASFYRGYVFADVACSPHRWPQRWHIGTPVPLRIRPNNYAAHRYHRDINKDLNATIGEWDASHTRIITFVPNVPLPAVAKRALGMQCTYSSLLQGPPGLVEPSNAPGGTPLHSRHAWS